MQHSDGVVTLSTNALQPWRLDEALKLADHSCVVDGHCLGWIPREQIRGIHASGRMLVCYNNDDLVGYVAWAASRGLMRIYYTWVRNDARLILHGRALVDHVDAIARQLNLPRVELWCATDLAANMFWRALGFDCVCWRWGRAKKSRRHYLWRRRVLGTVPASLPTLATPR